MTGTADIQPTLRRNTNLQALRPVPSLREAKPRN